MPGPATKLGSLTGHGGTVIGPGCSNVLIEKSPAIRIGADMHVCPMVTPGTPPIPHIGMNNIGPGCPTVLIGGLPASTVGDYFLCAGSPAPVVMGANTVFIGTGGVGGGNSSPQAKAEAGLKAGTISPIKGTETYPIEIQAIALVMQDYCTPEGQQLDMSVIDALAQEYERKKKEESGKEVLTIADVVEILKSLETEEGYEAARHFASEFDFEVLCSMTRKFIEGKDTDPRNDPNLMPTRFMILYGVDDSKLKEIDRHPDSFEGKPEHKMNVINLKKALRLMGSEVDESSFYDDKTYNAHLEYIRQVTSKAFERDKTHCVEEKETLGSIAAKYGLPTWKYLYQLNRDTIGDNPDLLKTGTELKIPQWDSTGGDEKIAAKGAKPSDYMGGIKYRYPWVPFSFSLGITSMEKTTETESYQKAKVCVIKNVLTGDELVKVELNASDDFNELVPDCQEYSIEIDGETWR